MTKKVVSQELENLLAQALAQLPTPEEALLERLLTHRETLRTKGPPIWETHPLLWRKLERKAEQSYVHLDKPLQHHRRDFYIEEGQSFQTPDDDEEDKSTNTRERERERESESEEHAPLRPLVTGDLVREYRILQPFHQGSMESRSFVATHPERDYLCLLKRYSPFAVGLDPEWMFVHQEWMIRRLNSMAEPRVEEILTHFLWEEDSYIQIKPLLYAGPLWDWLDEHDDRKARIPLLHALGEVVQKLHESGICHTDLKPAQVLMLQDPQSGDWLEPPDFVLIDYDFSMIDEEMTFVVGTVPYYAPEQYEDGGLRTHEDGVNADIYAYCVMVYRLMTERYPFGDGQSEPAMLDALKQAHDVDADQIPYAPLQEVLIAGMDPDPDERPDLQDILDVLASPEMLAAAESFPLDLIPLAREPGERGSLERSVRWTRWHSTTLMLILLCVCCLAIVWAPHTFLQPKGFFGLLAFVAFILGLDWLLSPR